MLLPLADPGRARVWELSDAQLRATLVTALEFEAELSEVKLQLLSRMGQAPVLPTVVSPESGT